MLPRFRKMRIKTPVGEAAMREVGKEDLRTLNAIVNEDGVNEFLLLEAPVSMKSTLDYYKERKRGHWLACLLGGRVVGSLELMPKQGREAHVSSFGIAFSSDVHGKGVAEAAVRALFAWAKRNGIEKIVSETCEKNLRARRFYRKLGFSERCILKKNVKMGTRYAGTVIIEKFL